MSDLALICGGLLVIALLAVYEFCTRKQMKKMEYKIMSQEALIQVLGEQIKEYEGGDK